MKRVDLEEMFSSDLGVEIDGDNRCEMNKGNEKSLVDEIENVKILSR